MKIEFCTEAISWSINQIEIESKFLFFSVVRNNMNS